MYQAATIVAVTMDSCQTHEHVLVSIVECIINCKSLEISYEVASLRDIKELYCRLLATNLNYLKFSEVVFLK